MNPDSQNAYPQQQGFAALRIPRNRVNPHLLDSHYLRIRIRDPANRKTPNAIRVFANPEFGNRVRDSQKRVSSESGIRGCTNPKSVGFANLVRMPSHGIRSAKPCIRRAMLKTPTSSKD